MSTSVKTAVRNLRLVVVSRMKKKRLSAPDVRAATHEECFLSSVAVPQAIHARQHHHALDPAEVNRSEAVCLTDDRAGSILEFSGEEPCQTRWLWWRTTNAGLKNVPVEPVLPLRPAHTNS